MSENLPVPVGPPLTEAALTALAMAAARIAAEQARPPVAAPLSRDDVEVIARAAVVEAFKQFGVDLDKVESVEAHRGVLDHARRAREFWGKAAGTVWTGLWVAIAGGVISAVVKFSGMGAPR